jgi:hypothetical protein
MMNREEWTRANEAHVKVLNAVVAERARQFSLGWTLGNDDLHTTNEWLVLIDNRMIELNANATTPANLPPGPNDRHLFVQIAALAAAAVESIDRRNP